MEYQIPPIWWLARLVSKFPLFLKFLSEFDGPNCPVFFKF